MSNNLGGTHAHTYKAPELATKFGDIPGPLSAKLRDSSVVYIALGFEPRVSPALKASGISSTHMSQVMRTLCIVILLCTIAFQSYAQTAIWVEADASDDMIGSRLAYSIRETIRKSSGMKLVDRSEDASIYLHFLSINPDKRSNENYRTSYAVTWTVQTFHTPPVEMYLTSSVGICGSDKVSSCAEGIAATTDEQAQKIRRWIRNALDKERK